MPRQHWTRRDLEHLKFRADGEALSQASEAAAPRRALLFLKLGVGRLADFGTSLNAFETTSVPRIQFVGLVFEICRLHRSS